MSTAAILEKRTSESIKYDINCALLLDSSETITGLPVMSSDAAGLSFGTPNINPIAITYDDGSVAGIGKVIQVMISAGTIPTGQTQQIYTVRAVFSTSSGNTREATVLLMVSNQAD
jgi:hypothetical protein